MLHYLLTICLCLCLAGPEAQAAPGTTGTKLLNMGQGEAVQETVLKLAFSKRPRYRLEVSGQRIDLFLYDTVIGDGFAAAPQQGGSVVKIDLVEKMTGLMVSFYMSGAPRGASVEMSGVKGMDLEVHVLWESAVGKVPPKVGARLVGGSGGGDNSIAARIPAKSKYSANWAQFYKDFETPIAWQTPVRYTFPDLPELATVSSPVLRAIWLRCQAGAWEDVASLLKSLGGGKLVGEERQAFLLLASASLLQEGQYQEARKLYRQFRQEFPHSPHLQRFTVMAASALARTGDPYGAVTEITPLLPKILEVGQPGGGAAELLYAEVQLAIGSPQKALSALAVIASDGPKLSRMVLLRTADARAAIGQYREALVGYRQWLAQAGNETMDLYSQAHWAETLEKQGELKAAAQGYARLAETPQVPDGRALALFAAARVARKLADASTMEQCVIVRRRHPGSEGSFRAWLLELDQIMLGADRELPRKRSGEYATIAATAPDRLLREEAAFKYALAVLQHGEIGKGVELLQAFRRDFAAGTLRFEAEVLLLQRLEPLVAGLMLEGKSYEAMVVIEQNRDLLSTFTLPPSFALQVAQIFREMGMYTRAGGIYLYLISHAEKKVDEETYYLPLVEVLYANGLQEDIFAAVARYRQRFPTGKSLAALLVMQGRLCLDLGRLDEAAALLKGLKDESAEVLALRNRLALAFTLRDGVAGPDLAGVLPGKGSNVEQPAARLLRAERLLREGKAEQALELYKELIAAELYVDQSRYRCGQIYLDRGERSQGINFLRTLVDKGKEKYWQELAREMLALASIG